MRAVVLTALQTHFNWC